MGPPKDLLPLIERSRRHFRVLSDEERHESLTNTLAQHHENDIWVFGYGSLVWRPEFHYTEKRAATLHGYHRALCLWSRVNRGTPERPGLVFGLDSGGYCEGVAYKLTQENRQQALQQLWQREMPTGAYEPRWVNCETPDGPVRALGFTVNRDTPAYTGQLSTDHLVWIIQGASGIYGSCTEYVIETAKALSAAKIEDKSLNHLVAQLNALC